MTDQPEIAVGSVIEMRNADGTVTQHKVMAYLPVTDEQRRDAARLKRLRREFAKQHPDLAHDWHAFLDWLKQRQPHDKMRRRPEDK
jgi:hypothetical protein